MHCFRKCLGLWPIGSHRKLDVAAPLSCLLVDAYLNIRASVGWTTPSSTGLTPMRKS